MERFINRKSPKPGPDEDMTHPREPSDVRESAVVSDKCVTNIGLNTEIGTGERLRSQYIKVDGGPVEVNL